MVLTSQLREGDEIRQLGDLTGFVLYGNSDGGGGGSEPNLHHELSGEYHTIM
jgi:hypothetical protein